MAQSCTPPSQRTWVIINDAGAGRDTVWFGFDPTATYGLNTPLCEIELPPPPPAGVFDVRFTNIPGHEGQDTPAGMGQGFLEDYRLYVGPADVDTHRVRLQAGDAGYPMTLTWDMAQILAISDSCILQDEFGGILVKVRMHAVTSVVVSNPAISTLLLIRYGQRVTGVDPISTVIPAEFGLHQNYPNPFNPSTTIRFDIQRGAQTDIAVFDILGRRIATLVGAQLAPGTYSTTWNGTNDLGLSVASGMYLVRMSALDEQGASFSAMKKIVFMK